MEEVCIAVEHKQMGRYEVDNANVKQIIILHHNTSYPRAIIYKNNGKILEVFNITCAEYEKN